jgi:hypothetical protein
MFDREAAVGIGENGSDDVVVLLGEGSDGSARERFAGG